MKLFSSLVLIPVLILSTSCGRKTKTITETKVKTVTVVEEKFKTFDIVLSNGDTVTIKDGVLDFSKVVSNTNMLPLGQEALISPLCGEPTSFQTFNECVETSGTKRLDHHYENDFDKKFSQGYGNYVTENGTPFRYLNDGETVSIQEINTQSDRSPTLPCDGGGTNTLRPCKVNGVVQYKSEVKVKFVD